MLSKRLSAVVLLVLALLLAGCGGESITDLYVQDVMDVLEGVEESIFTSSTILVESPGDEYNVQMIELLESNFRDPTNSRTLSQDFSTYVAVDVKVPILMLEDYAELWENDEAIGIIVVDMGDGSAAFGLGLNSDKLDVLFNAFAEEIWDSVAIEDFSFTIKLYNDMREPIFVALQGVYANQIPLPYEETFEMVRRDSIEIKLGDVARDAAYFDGIVVLGVID